MISLSSSKIFTFLLAVVIKVDWFKFISPNSIFKPENFFGASPNVDFAYKSSQKFKIPYGMKEFIKMFSDNYVN